MDDQPPNPEMIGVIVGAILLFAVISLIPILVMWYQKRNSASRRSSELRQLNTDGFVRHISVEQWLGSQPRNAEQYAQDICAICLSTLALRSDPVSRPEPALIRHTSFRPSPSLARLASGQAFVASDPDPDPDPGWDSHSDPDPDDLHDEQITVLSGCKHAFHESCLASWFEYQQNKCPMCQTPYFPAD